MSDYFNTLIKSVTEHEGFRDKPYRDTMGHFTIGYGFNLGIGITQDEAMMLLEKRLKDAEKAAQRCYGDFETLSDNRKAVLVEMAYQLGEGGLGGFKKMFKCISKNDFVGAHDAMLDSQWVKQTPDRAKALADKMKNG